MINKIMPVLPIIILFVFTGCTSFDDISISRVEHENNHRLEMINGKYKISPPDVIEISVNDNPELGTTAIVRPDGNIYMPLLGDVYVEGLTPLEIRKRIHKGLGKYLREIPEESISVGVVGFNSKMVYVFSFGLGLSQVPFTGDLTVLDAITRSGLLSRNSNEKKITVIRGTEDPEKKPQRLVLNLNDITKRGKLEKNIVLRPKDLIYIPPTILARIGIMVQDLFFPVGPIEQLGATAASVQTGGALGFAGQTSRSGSSR